MDYRLILLPVIGAIIGWLTNYIAIKMLFKPYHPVRILGFTFHGVLPKRREAFAHSLAKTIEKELLSSKDISEILEESGWEEEVEHAIEGIIRNYIRTESVKKYPIVGVLSDSILNSIKYYLSKEIIKQVEGKKPELLDRFHDMVNVRELVANKVDAFDIKRLEKLVFDLVARELRHIEIVGAVLGFIIGCVQVVIVHLLKY